jgi:hypothetical protein
LNCQSIFVWTANLFFVWTVNLFSFFVWTVIQCFKSLTTYFWLIYHIFASVWPLPISRWGRLDGRRIKRIT